MPPRSAIVRVGLGVLLLATAALKLYGLGVSAVPRVGWFALPWVQLLGAEWELVLGAWLLSGASPRLSWWAALITFVTFAGVSGYLGWVGVASCGCFGAIQANPWWAFGVDAAAVTLLLASRPVAEVGLGSGFVRTAGAWAGAVALTCGLLALAGSLLFGSVEAAVAKLRGERVSIRPGLVEMGTGAPGQTLEVMVDLVNRTDHPVRVIGGTSDCSCITTNDLPLTLEPGASKPVVIRVQLPAAPGVFNRKAYFWTDDDQARTIVFPLTGRIQP